MTVRQYEACLDNFCTSHDLCVHKRDALDRWAKARWNDINDFTDASQLFDLFEQGLQALHQPILMLEDAAVVERARQEMLGAHHRYEEAIASAMGQPCQFVRELCRRETRLNASEARKQGLVESIIDPDLALLFQGQLALALEDYRR